MSDAETGPLTTATQLVSQLDIRPENVARWADAAILATADKDGNGRFSGSEQVAAAHTLDNIALLASQATHEGGIGDPVDLIKGFVERVGISERVLGHPDQVHDAMVKAAFPNGVDPLTAAEQAEIRADKREVVGKIMATSHTLLGDGGRMETSLDKALPDFVKSPDGKLLLGIAVRAAFDTNDNRLIDTPEEKAAYQSALGFARKSNPALADELASAEASVTTLPPHVAAVVNDTLQRIAVPVDKALNRDVQSPAGKELLRLGKLELQDMDGLPEGVTPPLVETALYPRMKGAEIDTVHAIEMLIHQPGALEKAVEIGRAGWAADKNYNPTTASHADDKSPHPAPDVRVTGDGRTAGN